MPPRSSSPRSEQRPPEAARAVEERRAEEALIVDIDGYEGPLDLLLTLAQTQKVDLLQISILQLAEQYHAFIEKSRALRIELAADYLVMAAWLAFLKSRLLLPPDPEEDGPSAGELTRYLAFQLERLNAMRHVSRRLMGRDRLGHTRFMRGQPEQQMVRKRSVNYEVGLIDLMRAYARLRTRDEFRPYAFDRKDVFTMEQALERMRGLIGFAGDWTLLADFLPDGLNEAAEGGGQRLRSATAATFVAMLELARQGKLEIQQAETFSRISIRGRPGSGRE